MPKLVTWMNNQRVGELTKLANGAHTFKYAPEWLASRYARPLSLSLPLQRGNITSDAVFNFFDNLLPDSPIVRDRIVKRYHAKSRQPFDLLSEIGRDSVGAVTLIPEDETVTHPIMAWEKLTEARLEEVLTAYKADIPLGMIREENDFRISVAGAQEKTALLRIGNDWCIPKGITPTTHIIKLPIGEIRQPNATLDLSQSVDNEYYCLLLAKELGLNVPDAEIIKAGNVRALAVERFDRRWNAERTVLLRLPQEDMCQTFGLPSSVKYESDGGPGIARIMAFLMGSSEALKDRYDFMKFQVFQWLIGATDGHAKNFSVFIQAGGSYRLTPFYDTKGITPTTHIIKLPIGEIRQPNATLDLSQSVDNEYYCLLLAKELGLNVPDAEIIKAGNVRALAVERFDRRWNAERTVLLRLPQEDMCQTFGLPSSVKYESDGGPGIARIMAFLMGSSEALKDRYDFMKFQVFQWLIGATDGHAKNFSVFIQAGGSYRLTPFYD
ncbi:HipA domain-containing protein, partial [Escherichia coli]|nr:HipA domain-containing protein [Escherichia coli]